MQPRTKTVKRTTATVRTIKWVVEKSPLDNHWKIIVSLNTQARFNLTISRFDNGAVSVVNNEAPLLPVPVGDIRFIVDAVMKRLEACDPSPFTISD